ncbi:ABC-F family ATP-binding cassette domain-containing protein [Dyadobacter bucti]|uniref:ABC-F family ATP-binding cassette domain-containing protein n=1 Tax=Dyadobacter bucti TaxID=2572203 RepID=UPI003F70ACB8
MMGISVHTLSYIHPDREILFQNINLSLAKGQKAALVGNNGTGKSTLLRIIAGNLAPSQGEAVLSGQTWYVPQHLGQYDHVSVAHVLAVDQKLDALHAILAGEVTPGHFTILADDWDIEERVAAALSAWDLQHLDLFQTMQSLSGGEKTKVFLAGISIHSPDVVLLDEPSNHLDAGSREMLCVWIRKYAGTVMVVSHDRTLLNQLDTILELGKTGIEVFGGNYDFYISQKEGKLQALQSRLDENEKALKLAREKAREVAEQRQKKEARGKTQGQKQSLPRIIAGGRKTQAEQSTARIMDVHDERIDDLAENLQQIRTQIQDYQVLKIDLRKSGLHKGKILVEAKDINFSYEEIKLWHFPLSFQIRSGDRIRIEGKNGSGKTTLVNLLTGVLKPTAGELYLGDFRHIYIDQEYALIDNALSVFEQLQRFNVRHLPESALKTLLHYHQFPREVWHRKCAGLSGGEKMKLALCCISASNNMPDLLILDEPTNNLDVHSQNVLKEAVKYFDGAVLVISHDAFFINEINTDKTIFLD